MKRWRKQIRRVTEGLGDGHDKDVQIEFLCGILSAVTDKSCFPGIARLLAATGARARPIAAHRGQGGQRPGRPARRWTKCKR